MGRCRSGCGVHGRGAHARIRRSCVGCRCGRSRRRFQGYLQPRCRRRHTAAGGVLGDSLRVARRGTPGITERSSGYWLSVLEPEELERRFGSWPYGFYAYNVASSVSSVLFAEPQSGVFVAVRAWLQDEVRPRLVIAFLSAVPTTALIVWAIARLGRRTGAARSAGDDTSRGVIFVAAAVIVASAVLSYAYTKDEIMSTAGVFYAFAAFHAFRAAIAYSPTAPRLLSGSSLAPWRSPIVRGRFAAPDCITSFGFRPTVNAATGPFCRRVSPPKASRSRSRQARRSSGAFVRRHWPCLRPIQKSVPIGRRTYGAIDEAALRPGNCRPAWIGARDRHSAVAPHGSREPASVLAHRAANAFRGRRVS